MITQHWIDDTHQAVRLDISGSLTIIHARDLLSALTEAFAAAPTIYCDLSGVNEIDVAGMQLLCSSHRTAIKEGKQFLIQGIEREPLQTTIIRAGYTGKSGCDPNDKNPCILGGGIN